MKLSIIIPSFNEAATVAKAINRVKKAKLVGTSKEIIVVDDGSTDDTSKKLKKITGITKIRLAKNQGKGAAIKAGFIGSSRGGLRLKIFGPSQKYAFLASAGQPIFVNAY